MKTGLDNRMTNYTKIIVIAAFILFFSGCSTFAGLNSQKPAESEDFMMGTVISQKVYGKDSETTVKETVKRLREIEALMTINAPGGDINKLNASAGKKVVVLNREAIKILSTAKKYAELSNGAFDVTIGPLVKAWGIFTDHPRVPTQSEIDTLKKLVDFNSLIIDDKKSTAKLARTGQIVDLGAIAKGYAGDEALTVYKRHGIKSAYINLGGNVVVLGSKPDGSLWRIGIQNPRDINGVYLGIVSIKDKTVVTSGDYERFFEKDGKRYHHILDPKTGYPSDSDLISSTIVTDISMDADALSTSTFVLGLDEAFRLVESLPGVEAIFITKDKKVYITDGLKESFQFTDESKEYTYVKKR